jgi:hypothetical protein
MEDRLISGVEGRNKKEQEQIDEYMRSTYDSEDEDLMEIECKDE